MGEDEQHHLTEWTCVGWFNLFSSRSLFKSYVVFVGFKWSFVVLVRSFNLWRRVFAKNDPNPSAVSCIWYLISDSINTPAWLLRALHIAMISSPRMFAICLPDPNVGCPFRNQSISLGRVYPQDGIPVAFPDRYDHHESVRCHGDFNYDSIY